ncbi:hypothetical protein [Actinoplanes sp. L3-i22]|uniref:hypothetical protein n=1 Tax=Actinoplanes sp. L3-i22 TaxID=2836373 RepID=UPI001C77B0E7|nr:hypothetical protein [Actinoplanes sp. L3-i22]BCY08976.1 hypothetical protein L3i22_040640 [Actinoplanes sp. L3-i22]
MPTPEQLAAQQRMNDERRAVRELGFARLARPRRPAGTLAGPVMPLSAVPILQCCDLDRTIAFYEFLGFASDQLPGYVIAVAGDAEIHVSETGTVLDPGACFLHVSDVSTPHTALADRNTKQLSAIEQSGRPGRGIQSFTVKDPDGNEIRLAGPWR